MSPTCNGVSGMLEGGGQCSWKSVISLPRCGAILYYLGNVFPNPKIVSWPSSTVHTRSLDSICYLFVICVLTYIERESL